MQQEQFYKNNGTGVDTSTFANTTHLANLKSEVHKLYIGKIKNVPNNLSNLKSKADKLDVDKLASLSVYLSKLSDVEKFDVVQKCI